MLSSVAQRSKAYWGYSPDVLNAWRAELTLSAGDLRAMVVHVAVVDDMVAAFYALTPSIDAAWSLDHFWVIPELMRRGVGRTLLAHALDLAFSAGADAVGVDADPNAESFYVRYGAVRAGTLPAPLANDPHRVRPQLVFSGRLTRR